MEIESLKMELKNYFDVYIEFRETFVDGDRYKDNNGNICIGRTTNTGPYVYKGILRKEKKFITYCENIKVDFLNLESIFGSIEPTVNDNKVCLKDIKGYLEIETFNNYYIEYLDFSAIKYSLIFVMRDRTFRRITEILLKESKKIKTSFMARVNLDLEGRYKKLRPRRDHWDEDYIDSRKYNRLYYDSSTSDDNSNSD